MDLTVAVENISAAPLTVDSININGTIVSSVNNSTVTVTNCTESVLIEVINNGYYTFRNYIDVGAINQTFLVTLLTSNIGSGAAPGMRCQSIQKGGCDCCYGIYYSSSNEQFTLPAATVHPDYQTIGINWYADYPNAPFTTVKPALANWNNVGSMKAHFGYEYCYPEGTYTMRMDAYRLVGNPPAYNIGDNVVNCDQAITVTAGDLAPCSDSVISGVVLNRLAACCPDIEIDGVALEDVNCAYANQVLKITLNVLFPYEDGCDSTVTVVVTNQTTGAEVLRHVSGPVTSDSSSYDLWNSNPFEIQVTLPSNGKYSVTTTFTTCNETKTCEKEIDTCASWQTVRTGCHKYHVCNLFPNIDLSGLQVKIDNYAGDYTQTVLFSTSGEAGTGCFSLTFPKDDVYILTITDSNAPDEDPIKLVVYDLCDYNACYSSLMKQLMCNEPDPCCDDCPSKEEEEKLKLELMKLSSLYDYAYSYINKERIDYVNVIDIDDCRDKILAKISDIIAKLREVTNRCGSCDDSTTTTSTNGGCGSC